MTIKCLYNKEHDCSKPTYESCGTCDVYIDFFKEGKKFDSDKLRWDLLPLKSIEETVKVLTFGANKYGPNNWKQVKDAVDRYYGALMRHIVAWRAGEICDKESNISHLAHAICNLVFLYELTTTYEVTNNDTELPTT